MKKSKKKHLYTAKEIRAYKNAVAILLQAIIDDIIESKQYDRHLSAIVDSANFLISTFKDTHAKTLNRGEGRI